MACSAPSHCLSQLCLIVNWTRANKIQWHCKNIYFIFKNAIEISSANWRPFFLCINMLMYFRVYTMVIWVVKSCCCAYFFRIEIFCIAKEVNSLLTQCQLSNDQVHTYCVTHILEEDSSYLWEVKTYCWSASLAIYELDIGVSSYGVAKYDPVEIQLGQFHCASQVMLEIIIMCTHLHLCVDTSWHV